MVQPRRMAALLMSAILLCGCQKTPPTPTTEPTTAPTTIQTQPTTEPTTPTEPTEEIIPPISEPPAPENPQTLAPVTKLTCTKWVTFPQLLSLGEGKVAASRNYYDKAKKDYVNSLQLLDIYSDKILAQVDTDTTLELIPQQFPDGSILTADPHAREIVVYDGTLAEQNRISVPNTDGFFSYDRSRYYYVDGSILCHMETATGKRGRLPLHQELRLERLVGIHPTADLLIARVYTDNYSDNCALAVIDAQRGHLRLLSGKLANVWLTGDTFYGVAMNDTAYGMDVYHGTFSGNSVQRITASKIGDDQMGWSVMPGSHLLVRRFAPDNDKPRNTCLLDLKQGTMVNLDDYGYIDCTFGTVWLHDEQLIMGFYEKGDYFYPVLLDPKAMTFTPGATGEEIAWPGNVDISVLKQEQEADSSLQQLREAADTLEQKYQIRILLGKQTEAGCAYARRTAQTATDPGQIQAALDALDVALSQYPQDYFLRFRGLDNQSGIQLLLTGPIEGSLPTTGFTALLRDRYVIGLDITTANLTKTLHHELSHATEMVLSTDSFDADQWASLNPEGYKYYGIYDSGYLNLTKWTYSGGSGADSHFVDSYARINPREDRARLWEEFMTTDCTDLLRAPALQGKLRLMLQIMGNQFPTDPWASVL